MSLNISFRGCEGHHVTKDHIIYIPEELHKLYPHNHKVPNTMKILNQKAFDFLFGIKRG